jgi:DNA topoisomerase-1
MALQEFQEFDTKAALKRNVKAAIERVASRLGNTPTICRKCYVHPEVLTAFAEGQLLLQVKGDRD